MLNRASLAAVNADQVRPAYGGYCFAHLPATVLRLLGAPDRAGALPLPPEAWGGETGAERVIVCLIDAFGWRLFEEHAEAAPFLREMLAGGVVSQMTSMFPSTTAAHTTCVHTGLPVAASGVHEWFYYEPAVDVVIAPLLFSPAGETERDVLRRRGITPAQLFPAQTVYQDLRAAGVPAYAYQSRAYAHSAFSTHVLRGARLRPYTTWPEALTNLRADWEAARGRAYFFLYFDAIDALSHHYGPASPQVRAEVRALLHSLDEFLRAASGQPRRTLLLVTADHGQTTLDPAAAIVLNTLLPDLPALARPNRRGQPLLFGGSPRDTFLYIRDEHLAEVESRLARALAGRGVVRRTADLLADGLFGPPPVSARLLERLGNLVVLPAPGEAVYWLDRSRPEAKYRGHHGGLTPDEMLVPLLAYRF